MAREFRVFVLLCSLALGANLPGRPAAAAHLQVIHSFTGADGADPTGGIVADNKGVLYGTTPYGGEAGVGTVFSLTPPKKGKKKWKFQTLYSFQGGTDGQHPFTGLALDHNGVLYGTVYDGFQCGSSGCGGVFTLTPPAKAGGKWTKTTIFQFSANDGLHPLSTPIFDAAGALNGTTGTGPGGTAGIVYALLPRNRDGVWNETILYDGRAVTGGFSHPIGVAVDRDGNVFGTATDGDAGAVFELADGNAQVLLPFGGDGLGGVTPLVPPILDVLGNLYGTTSRGGDPSLCPNSPGCGTVWRLRPASDMSFWSEDVLHDFAFFTNHADGQDPGDGVPFPAAFSPLLLDSETLTLYGSTFYGGSGTLCGGINGSCGTIFRLDFDGSNYAVLWDFPDGGGAAPEGQLALFKGTLYGTTFDGGTKCSSQHYLGCGTVFKLTP